MSIVSNFSMISSRICGGGGGPSIRWTVVAGSVRLLILGAGAVLSLLSRSRTVLLKATTSSMFSLPSAASMTITSPYSN